MRNLPPPPPPPLNELSTYLWARSCLVALVALPLFGMSALSGQTTDEADGASHLTEVVRSGNGDDAPYSLVAGPTGTLIRHRSINAAGWGVGRESGSPCIRCTDWVTPGGVEWHITGGSVPPGVSSFRVGHAEHPDNYLQGACFYTHLRCLGVFGAQELAREISDAVAAQEVAALAAYAKMPSVILLAERSAIRIRGCDGDTIVADIPVIPELLDAVAMTAAQSESDR